MFEEFALRNLRVKNRIVRSALNDYLADENGMPTQEQEELFVRLGQGGAGLIISGHFYVSDPYAKAGMGQTGICSDAYIAPLSKLAAAAQQDGAKVIAQLNHAGARAPLVERPLGPVETDLLGNGVKAKALTPEEMEQIKQDFVAAALRAKKAGFDGVQIHCAHGYLLSQFIDPAVNTREDEFGGNVMGRFKLAEEILFDICAACGEEFPVMVKINSNTTADDEAYEDELAYMLRRMDEIGIAAAELSGTPFALKGKPERPYFIERAAKMADEVGIPLILVGGVASLENAKMAVERGIELVSYGRPFISEQDVASKLQRGETPRCVYCNSCVGKGKCILDKQV
ncbi:MAG: NADH:flavin oxidoreductase [Christensenellaceae bacterium]|jgi:2,4-dienoyl-CoA reductase-like NADH-dependent reductase (Old Yellow Enzyme family)